MQLPKPWRLPPSRDTSSSPLALGEALLGLLHHHLHHAIVLVEIPSRDGGGSPRGGLASKPSGGAPTP